MSSTHATHVVNSPVSAPAAARVPRPVRMRPRTRMAREYSSLALHRLQHLRRESAPLPKLDLDELELGTSSPSEASQEQSSAPTTARQPQAARKASMRHSQSVPRNLRFWPSAPKTLLDLFAWEVQHAEDESEDDHVPDDVVHALVLLSWNAVFMAAAEFLMELLMLGGVIYGVEFRTGFTVLTALSMLFAVHCLADVRNDELDTTLQAFRMTLATEIGLVLGDVVYILKAAGTKEGDYRGYYRWPFVALTLVNVVLVVYASRRLRILLEVLIPGRASLVHDGEPSPQVAVRQVSDGVHEAVIKLPASTSTENGKGKGKGKVRHKGEASKPQAIVLRAHANSVEMAASTPRSKDISYISEPNLDRPEEFLSQASCSEDSMTE